MVRIKFKCRIFFGQIDFYLLTSIQISCRQWSGPYRLDVGKIGIICGICIVCAVQWCIRCIWSWCCRHGIICIDVNSRSVAGKMADYIVHLIVVQPIRTLFTIHLSALYFKILSLQIFISTNNRRKIPISHHKLRIRVSRFGHSEYILYILFVALSCAFRKFRKFKFHTFKNIIPNECVRLFVVFKHG